MKKAIKTTAIMACILFMALMSCAQVPPPPVPVNTPGLPPLPQGVAVQPAPAPNPGSSLQQLTSLKGNIGGYLVNDRYEYDGISLQAGSNKVTVRFPAHLGAQLMNAAPKGTAISINGFYKNSPQGDNDFQFVNATIGSAVIADSPPAIPVNPPVEEQKTFTGSISDFRRGPDGTINGIVLAGKEVIELPPPAAGQLQNLLASGEKISGIGIKTVPPQGVVMAEKMTVIHPQTLTLKGQTYLVR